MWRVHTPVARRLVGQFCAVGLRRQSSAAAATSLSAVPTIRIRSRGYGPSRDLLSGIPQHAALSVEATLHPEDAAVQRAVLELSMPSLAAVHVTPVVPHDSYAGHKVPQRTGAVFGSGDVITAAEREVMEQCLQEQLADVANLIVEQVGQRTGQQLDALQVTQTDEMRNFAEIILHSMQDELRQLRLARPVGPTKGTEGSQAALPSPANAAAASFDVEAIAQVVSAKVMERLASGAALTSAALDSMTPTTSTVFTEAVLEDIKLRTAAYFDELQARMQSALSSKAVGTAAVDDIRTAVMEAVEVASAAQQEHLANLVNDWIADTPHTLVGSGSSSVAAPVDTKALEEMVENAVQISTDELRRVITSEVKKLDRSRKATDADEGADSSELVTEVEKVFDVVQATQNRLAAVDEVVGDVFKEQASTREALQTIQHLLQQQLREVHAASLTETTPRVAQHKEGSDAPNRNRNHTTEADDGMSATVTAVEAAVASLQHELAAAQALATVQQEEMQRQLMTVAQVVSDSVSTAVQYHTAEAVQSALATVQQQLDSLQAIATTAEAEKTAAAQAASVASVEPISKEMLADVVESVLTPHWSTLAAEVEKINAANQQAIEQQLFQMANSVAASVMAGVQEQLEMTRIQSEKASVAPAAEVETGKAANDAAEVAAVSAATALVEKTTQELTTLREELMSAIQVEMRKSHEVDLTPMYKYIDSVLTFMKEELHVQETSLTAKMTSLADTVTAAVREQQERPPSHAAASLEREEERDGGSTPTPAPVHTTAATTGVSDDATTPSTATFIVPTSLTNTLDLQTGALRHLEEKLNELSLTQSRDMSTLLAHLQEATADFRATTSAPSSSPAPLHADQLAWQSGVTAQLTSLEASLKRRDADLLAAVKSAAVADDVKTQLTQLEGSLQSLSAAQKDELLSVLRDVVSSNAQEQSSRVDALVQRIAEMQRTLHDQAVAVELLLPSPALRGMTAEQRQTQARIRTSTQECLHRLTQIMEEMTDAAQPTDASGSVAEKLQAELQKLRQLQEEEAALHRDVAAASAPDGDPATDVESIVRTEVDRAQAVIKESVHVLTSHYDKTHEELAKTLNTLLASVHKVSGNVSSVPSIADIQELLDATLLRLEEAQKDAGVHVTQLVTAATRTSAEELKSAVKSTLSESIATSVEQRIIPAYHEKVEASLQTRLTEQAAVVVAAVAGVKEHTTAVVGKVESLVSDVNAQRIAEAQRRAAEQHTVNERLGQTRVQSHMPWWWMLSHALLVCLVVLLCLYYVFVCLLLAFVPKPPEEAPVIDSANRATDGVGKGVDGGVAADANAEVRRGSRYVDRFL